MLFLANRVPLSGFSISLTNSMQTTNWTIVLELNPRSVTHTMCAGYLSLVWNLEHFFRVLVIIRRHHTDEGNWHTTIFGQVTEIFQFFTALHTTRVNSLLCFATNLCS